MKILSYTVLLLTAFCSMAASAASHLEILHEPAYAQTRYAVSRENCKLMWIVRAVQEPAFSIREMRSCDLQEYGKDVLPQLRAELLAALQQGRPAIQDESSEKPTANLKPIPARALVDMLGISVGRLEELPHWQLALQQALAADPGWRAARSKMAQGQGGVNLAKRVIEIANREAIFADLAKIFEPAGYSLRLRNIEKLRFLPDGRVLDCQLFFSLTPQIKAQSVMQP